MSFSNGTFSINSTGQPVVTGTVISSTVFNAFTADIATGLSTCMLKDGTQTLTGNIPFGTFKITGLGAGTALTDGASITQVQNQFGSYLTSVSGTNTVVGTATPTPAYAVGQRFTLIPTGTNTGATTLNISSVGAGAVQRDGGALTGGEFEAGTPVTVLVTAATPVFEIVGSGQQRGPVQIVATTNLPAANVANITNIPSGFSSLILYVAGASSDTATRAVDVRYSTDNGSTWSTSGVYGSSVRDTTVSAQSNVGFLALPNPQTAAQTTSFSLIIHGYGTGSPKNVQVAGAYADVTAFSHNFFIASQLAINGLRITWDSTGNFDAGNYSLWGLP